MEIMATKMILKTRVYYEAVRKLLSTEDGVMILRVIISPWSSIKDDALMMLN
jgi:hypothetical protein